MNYKLTAVAVVEMGGFLAESAPVAKFRQQVRYILLTHDQRMYMYHNHLINRVDAEVKYRGVDTHQIPPGFYNIEERRGREWYQAENQWLDAQALYSYVLGKFNQIPEDERSYRMTMLVSLLEKASKV